MCIPVVLFFLFIQGPAIRPFDPRSATGVPHPSLPFIRLKEVHFLKITIQGVSFDDLTLAQAVMAGAELVRTDGFHYVVTPNPEFVMLAQRDPEFQTLLNQADLTIPDGIGIIYAAKLLGTPLSGRVPGIDFASGVMAELNSSGGGRVYLLGAKPGVAEDARKNLSQRYPALTFCGCHDGYFQEDGPVVEAVKSACPDLLLVCLGAPKQERWMSAYGPSTGAHLAIGLGGALDVYAGRVERAPERWQKLGLEWLYRLKKEPKRIGRMARLPLFLIGAVGTRIRGRQH